MPTRLATPDRPRYSPRVLTQTDILTPSLLARFRATLDLPADGPVAEQGIHWCLFPPMTPTGALGPDGHPPTGSDGLIPPIPLPRRMWAASDVTFLASLREGDVIRRDSRLISCTEKSGASGRLVFVELEHNLSIDGQPAIREVQTLVYKDMVMSLSPSSGAIPADQGPWMVEEELTPSATLLLRYSALTFNAHRIHYDRRYALEVEGYSDLVVHGPLNATLLLDLARRHGGPVRRFKFRGVAPAYVDRPVRYALRRPENLPEAARNLPEPVEHLPELVVLKTGGQRVMSAWIER